MEHSIVEGYKDWLITNDFMPSSLESYLRKLKRILFFFEEIGVVSPSDLTTEIIPPFETWLIDQKYNPSTRATYIHVFKSFTRFLTEKGHLLFDVGDKIKPPKKNQGKIKQIPSRTQIIELIDSVSKRQDKLIIGLLYFTGLRSNELAHVMVDDIDMSQRSIFIQGKGGHERYVYFPKSLVFDLKLFLNNRNTSTPYLFEGKDRGFLKDRVRSHCQKVGLPYKGTHFLRYSIATHLYEMGAHVRLIQTLLGHKRLVSTMQYIRPSVDYLKAIHGKYHPINRFSL